MRNAKRYFFFRNQFNQELSRAKSRGDKNFPKRVEPFLIIRINLKVVLYTFYASYTESILCIVFIETIPFEGTVNFAQPFYEVITSLLSYGTKVFYLTIVSFNDLENNPFPPIKFTIKVCI